METTWSHLDLALDREIFVGEIIFDNLLFMQWPDFRRWLNRHIIALMFYRMEGRLKTACRLIEHSQTTPILPESLWRRDEVGGALGVGHLGAHLELPVLAGCCAYATVAPSVAGVVASGYPRDRRC